MWLSVAFVVSAATTVVPQVLVDRPPPPWWQSMVLYQVYPRSFYDSDGDGSGDLRGIIEKAHYLKELGVDAVLLLPVYTSPKVDGGFDISNHTDIDPLFGTMKDFEDLVTKLKELDIKLIVDFVPNHTSDEHPWFKKSVQEDPEFNDFYIWMNPKRGKGSAREPPNNWMSVFSGSAWEWSEERDQYYLHLFHKKMPDLNYRNPAVVDAMTNVLKFWLDKGVDGFRIAGDAFLYKDEDFPDAPAVPGASGDTYLTQNHKYFTEQPETFVLLRRWADVLYDRVRQDQRDRLFLLEVYDEEDNNFYGTGKENLMMSVCFNLMWHVNQATKPFKYKALIEECMSHVPSGDITAWAVGVHDSPRIPNRYGSEMVDAINLLTGVMPGIKMTYYGEEIGMSDTFVQWEQSQDPAGRKFGSEHYLDEGGSSRDPVRTPMQWDNTTNAGFSSANSTWLPVNPNYWWLNVEAQRVADSSHLKVFQATVKTRKDPVFKYGSLNVSVVDNDFLVVTRSLVNTYFILVINMGIATNSYNILPPIQESTIVVASVNSGYTIGQSIDKGPSSLLLRPKAAVLLKTITASTTPSGASQNTVSLAAVIVTFCTVLGLQLI